MDKTMNKSAAKITTYAIFEGYSFRGTVDATSASTATAAYRRDLPPDALRMRLRAVTMSSLARRREP